MKFYQNRGFALVVLVLAILGSCVYGICESPSAALDVERAAIQEHGLWAKASVLVGEGPHVVG